MPLAVIRTSCGVCSWHSFELYEAATRDGARLPDSFASHAALGCPDVVVVLILKTRSAIRAFDVISCDGGGPGDETNDLTWQTVLTTFASSDFGHGQRTRGMVRSPWGFALALFRSAIRRGNIET